MLAGSLSAQTAPPPAPTGGAGAAQVPGPQAAPADAPPVPVRPTDAAGTPLPVDYVIGPSDVLNVVYWREENLSAEVTVRPDGRISLPLINDVQAAGLTPDALRQRIVEAASQYVESPVVSVNVKVINSRKVYITGMVAKPGEYPLVGPTTVLQLLAIAGGLQEYADKENIMVIRPSEKNFRGDPFSFRVNYNDLARRRNLQQNIELKPGDTIVVP
jgi:polysaccharide export outer membrane protein